MLVLESLCEVGGMGFCVSSLHSHTHLVINWNEALQYCKLKLN